MTDDETTREQDWQLINDEAVETVRTALTRGRHSVEPYPEVVAFDSLVQRLREAEERAEKAEGWLRFIAETQHRLLEAIHLDLTDEEWALFDAALREAKT